MADVDFQRDDADVAIRYGFGQWAGVRIEHLLDDSFFPVCSPRIAGGVPKRPADLARYPLLRSDNEPWKPWFEAAGLDWPEPDRGPIFNDSSHMMQAAAEGEGIALGRATLLGNDERNGVLIRPFAIEVPAPRRFYLVYPPRNADLPKLATFRAWLQAEIAAEPEGGRCGAARNGSPPAIAEAACARPRAALTDRRIQQAPACRELRCALAASVVDAGPSVRAEAASTASETAKIDSMIEKTTSSMVVLDGVAAPVCGWHGGLHGG